jgi:hypothetical protein
MVSEEGQITRRKTLEAKEILTNTTLEIENQTCNTAVRANPRKCKPLGGGGVRFGAFRLPFIVGCIVT